MMDFIKFLSSESNLKLLLILNNSKKTLSYSDLKKISGMTFASVIKAVKRLNDFNVIIFSKIDGVRKSSRIKLNTKGKIIANHILEIKNIR